MKPQRGEVWLVDLNPVKGHEQSGKRPALIVSVDIFNQGPADLVVVIPITTKNKGIPLHVRINPPRGGLNEISYAKCEDIRSISKERLLERYGSVPVKIIAEIEDRIRILLGL